MGIPLGPANFTRGAQIPLDDTFQCADTTARDAIVTGVRYEGMIVYVVADGLHYALIGGITNSDWGPIAGGGGGSDLISDLFSGDGVDTTFTLSADPITELNTWVFVSGVFQQKNTYSISGTTLTFSTAPPTGTNNIEVMQTAPLSIGTPSNDTVSTAKLQNGAVTGPKIGAGAVSVDKLAANSRVETTNINVSVTSTSFGDFTNNSLSFTTSGGELEFGFCQGTTKTNIMRADISATGSVDTMFADFQVSETTGGTIMGTFRLGFRGHTTNSNWVYYGCPSAIKGFYTLTAGTYTIKVQAKVSTSNNLALTDCKFNVKERI